MLIISMTMAQRTVFVQRDVDPALLMHTWWQVDSLLLLPLDQLLELEESNGLEALNSAGCSRDLLPFQEHCQVQAQMSHRSGGL